jgi:hypothetical protein
MASNGATKGGKKGRQYPFHEKKILSLVTGKEDPPPFHSSAHSVADKSEISALKASVTLDTDIGTTFLM